MSVVISLIDQDYDYEKIDDLNVWLCLMLAHLHNFQLPYTT